MIITAIFAQYVEPWLIQLIASMPNQPMTVLIIPTEVLAAISVVLTPTILNIAANTIPIAIELVTYGKKKIVCNKRRRGLIAFRQTAISSAKKVESGTVSTQSSTVFCMISQKPS